MSLLRSPNEENKPLDGDVDVSEVVQDKVDKLLVAVFADKLDKRLRRERLAEFVRRQTVLSESKVVLVQH